VVQEDNLNHQQLLMLLSAHDDIKVLLTFAVLQSTLSQRAASALLARPYCPGNKILLRLTQAWFDNVAKFRLAALSWYCMATNVKAAANTFLKDISCIIPWLEMCHCIPSKQVVISLMLTVHSTHDPFSTSCCNLNDSISRTHAYVLLIWTPVPQDLW